MAFRSIRFHDHMPFADTYSQDMDFWRQRVNKETRRDQTPTTYDVATLDDLPCNPFVNSAGMLKGQGVSPRSRPTTLGTLAPDLAAYRAVVPTSPMAKPPLFAHTHTHAGQIQRPYWQIARTPYSLGGSELGTPEERASRGASVLNTAVSLAGPPEPVPPAAYEKQGIHGWGRAVEAPNQRIIASIRRGMPRARLDARMYSPSPG